MGSNKHHPQTVTTWCTGLVKFKVHVRGVRIYLGTTSPHASDSEDDDEVEIQTIVNSNLPISI